MTWIQYYEFYPEVVALIIQFYFDHFDDPKEFVDVYGRNDNLCGMPKGDLHSFFDEMGYPGASIPHATGFIFIVMDVECNIQHSSSKSYKVRYLCDEDRILYQLGLIANHLDLMETIAQT